MDGREADRLRALRDYAVLDTQAEPNFDRITLLGAKIFDKPVCTLSLADADRHWFKSQFGVDIGEMKRGMSFCDETIKSDNVLVVPDARADTRFANGPVVCGAPYVRFYAGAPLIAPGGQRIGSLCVLDTKPDTSFSETDGVILTNLAYTAVELLEARAREIRLANITESIAHLARHDPLTGLANRLHLAERLERKATMADPQDQFALLFLDLDRFKAINDGHGHAIGDEVLKQVARRLEWGLSSHESLARIGGDEFAILHRGADSIRRTAAFLSDELIARITEPYAVDGLKLEIGVSIGIAVSRASTGTLDILLRQADLALYQAKSAGRGRFCFFDAIRDDAGIPTAA